MYILTKRRETERKKVDEKQNTKFTVLTLRSNIHDKLKMSCTKSQIETADRANQT